MTGLVYRRLRAPRDHGEHLIDPPRAKLAKLIQANSNLLGGVATSLLGVPFSELRQRARSHLLQRATDYTRRYRDVDDDRISGSAIVMSGHQPQLFHPGVWYKNFQLDAIAREHNAVAIQLLIDNDLCRTTSIRVPGGSCEAPAVRSIPFDRGSDPVPYERREILDDQLFSRFGHACKAMIRPLVPDPLVEKFWPTAIDASVHERNLGLAVASARHQLEGSWGLQTIELPLSVICETEAFHTLVAILLSSLERFAAHYNLVVSEYRRMHRIRNHVHPVPNLARDGEYTQAPLWVWTADPRRRPVWVRKTASTIELTDREQGQWIIPADPNKIRSALCDLAERGIKLRPRALITTLFARMFLCDLFIHGIGGSKYDQLTDELIRFLFASEAPAYATITATVLLPVARAPSTQRDLVGIERELRDMRFHPETHISSLNNNQVSRLVEQKKTLLRRCPPRGQRQNWHREVSRINNQLQIFIQDECNALQQRKSGLEIQLRNNQILSSREFAFCLYPEAVLQTCLSDVAV